MPGQQADSLGRIEIQPKPLSKCYAIFRDRSTDNSGCAAPWGTKRSLIAVTGVPRLEGLGGSWHDGKIASDQSSEDRPATARSPGGEGGQSVEPRDEKRDLWRLAGPIRGRPPRLACSNRREGVWLRITFHGATRQVTGSAHLLEIGSKRILLDCGLFDSDRIDPDSPNRQFAFDPRELDAVIVSHAHNDHIGRLPCPDPGGLYRADLHHAGHRRHRQRHAPRQRADPARGSAQRPRRSIRTSSRSSRSSSWPTSSGWSSGSSGSRTGRRSRSCRGSP